MGLIKGEYWEFRLWLICDGVLQEPRKHHSSFRKLCGFPSTRIENVIQEFPQKVQILESRLNAHFLESFFTCKPGPPELGVYGPSMIPIYQHLI